jgi:tRNA(Arg) A34 adenosine deaminase TadA
MYTVTDEDREYLRRCVELATEAAENGDQPFGSLLVDASGTVLFEDRNRTGGGDLTRHPEFAIARWAAENVAPEDRADCTVYTSGEHCAMCAAAHAIVGLGRIVYASSGDQYRSWLRDFGIGGRSALAPLAINAVAPHIPVAGPDPELANEVRALHERLARGDNAGS